MAGTRARRVAAHTLRGSEVVQREAAVRELGHDLRHHLATIAALTCCVEAGALDEEAQGYLAQVQREVALMRALCQRVLEERMRWTTVRLDEIVAESVCAAQVRSPCRLSLESRPAPMEGDVTDLRRIIDNLMSNACEAAGEGGSVEVRVGADDDRVTVDVADDGPGFQEAMADHGHGLGLRIVDQLVRDHAGQLSVGRNGRGGTRVQVSFPRATASGTATVADVG